MLLAGQMAGCAGPNQGMRRWRLRATTMLTSAFAAVGALIVAPAQAQTSWTGSVSNDWFTAGNWTAGLPTGGQSTRLDTITPNSTVIAAPGAVSQNLLVGVTGLGQLAITSGGTLANGPAYLGLISGSQGQVSVSGAGSSWTNSDFLAVGESGSGQLTIASGGTVSNTLGVIGANAGSQGTVTVTGPGSTWTNNNFGVGRSGAGQLTIENGGAVSNMEGYIGVAAGSQGSVTVNGLGSTWTNSSFLAVGQNGSGQLTIAGGGTVSNALSVIGANAGSQGTATVTGPGSTWTNSGGFAVGNSGVGQLTIENGGAVSNVDGHVGVVAGSQGTVTVTGPGSTWTNSSFLTVGESGAGRLTIENGGMVSNTEGYVGGAAGSQGAVNVTGPGSTWTNSNFLSVGENGSGQLTIANGGTVSNTLGVIGANADSRGTATVTGPGSTWTNSDGIAVGASGVGQLTIENGGAVSNVAGYVGRNAGSQGTVRVIGQGSTWSNSHLLSIGEGGTGELTIANSGAVSGAAGFVGRNAGSQGTVTVTGAGSTWTSSGFLSVGESGTGQLTIADGGAVSNVDGYIGVSAGSQGAVTVTGQGSTWSNSAWLSVGENGTGQLTIANGGAVSSNQGIIGFSAGSQGAVVITGPGSTWTDSAIQAVGNSGVGQLTIANGGTASTAQVQIANLPGSSGTAEVTGAGSTWTSTGAFVVGRSGNGQLTIADGAQVNAGTRVRIGLDVGSTGNLNIGAPVGHAAVAPGNLNTSTVLFGDGNGTLTFNHNGTAYAFAPAIDGNGTVSVLSGTTIFTANSTYTGPTIISGGLLVVNGAIASTVTLTGGTLGGSGTIGGILVQSGGIVAPGNSIGTLSIAGNVAFTAGSTYQVEVNAAGQSDRIATTGSAALSGGTVQVVTQAGSYRPLTSYTILTASGGVSGQFSGVTTNFAFLTPALFYEPTAVTLQLTRNSLDFAAVAATRNQFATGGGVESLGFGNPVYDAVLFAAAPEARVAFDQLSGEIHASAQTAAVETSQLVRDAALGRLRSLGDPSPSGSESMVASAYSADLAGKAAEPMPMRSFDPRVFTLWAQGLGSLGRTDGNGNAAKLDRSTGGFLLGAEATIDERWRVGVAGGYTQTSIDVNGRLSSGDLSSVHGVLYGGASFGALQLRTGLAFAHNDYDVDRRIAVASLGDATKASYEGRTLQAFGEVGYRFGFGAAMIEPFVGAAAIRVSTDRFAETGGVTALTGKARDLDIGTTTLGLRGEMALGTAWPLTVRGLVGWRHAFGDATPTALLAFRSGGAGFAVAGIPVDRDSLVAEAGIDWQLTDRASASLSYVGAIGSRAQEHGVKGVIAVRF